MSRDWRAGELRVLIAALVLAVASVGTVGFFTDRVKGALTRQANLLLGADLLLSGDRPLPDSFMREARSRGLAAVPAIKFNSMVQAAGGDGRRGAGRRQGGRPRAIRCAARLLLVDPANAAGTSRRACRRRAKSGSTAGSRRVWARSKASKLAVGESTFTVGAIVQQDPEVTGGLLALGPRLMMNLDDVAATQAAAAGQSRVVSLAGRGRRASTRSATGRRRTSTADSGWNRFATCGPKCGRRSSAPNSSWASRRWSR